MWNLSSLQIFCQPLYTLICGTSRLYKYFVNLYIPWYVEPLVFTNILSTSVYPDMWNLSSLQIFCQPLYTLVCGTSRLYKYFVNLCIPCLWEVPYAYLHTNDLITKNQSGFRRGDSTTNQLLYHLHEINQAFDSTKSFAVRTVFLDISRAVDKVWHDGNKMVSRVTC